MKKRLHIGLLGKILIAIVLGILTGYIFNAPLVRIFVTFNAIFSEFLNFVIPLIILALVADAIGDIGKGAGKMLLITTAIAYGSTVFSGYLAYFTGSAVFPSLITPGEDMGAIEEVASLQPFFTIGIPPAMSVMTALVLAFTLGLGMASLKSFSLKNVVHDFKEIISDVIVHVIIPLLPLYIYSIFLNMTFQGQVMSIILVFIKIIGIIFALHIILLILQFSVAGAIVRRNPFQLLWRMLPAYFTALGTCSSAATIPVTLKQCKLNGVTEDIAGFTVPLCATIHLSGSTLKIVSCALALMIMHGMPHDIGLFSQFIFMLGITMVAAPGVPGGAIMAALAILQSILGFDPQMQALMISLYITMDNFGTACNVTGDGAISLIVDKIVKKELPESVAIPAEMAAE
ncbi:dicarboxylate/amino acid:cation symporter [Porphyromonas pogonae]|uniref:dicarboxylate/amino acid:cation symporter n=1 Tax=Porphyromonas pogonae TaxID=867595 RepID=UPI002E784838|nr:dicarboxylate/amino acid:cation symporter [Porphyromonas pogonae]